MSKDKQMSFDLKEVKDKLELALQFFNKTQYSDAMNIYIELLQTTRIEFARRICFENIFFLYSSGEQITFPIVRGPAPIKIPLTMTTCKRPHLFKRTIESFINYTDSFCVDYICIIDDGSSEEDVTVMEKCVENYDIPYKFIRKKEKGHAKSMNLIVDTMSDLRARFFIHLEDDFEFFVKAPIIQDSLKVLSQEKYGQCLFNNSYKEERVDFMSTPYGIKKRVDNVVFYEHLWNDNTPYGYWPGFSLRPGVNRLKSFTTTGKFIENGSSFEMEYALRYEQKWKTAYLETIFCEHIGRKTSERFDVDKQNAYVLNDTKQFGDLNKVSISSAKIESKIPFQEKKELYSHIKLWMMLSENYTNEQIYVVNDPKISSPLMEKLSQIHFYWDVVLVRKDQTMLRMVSAEKICENELKNGYILYHTGARKLLEKVYESPMNTIAEYMKRAELIIYETY